MLQTLLNQVKETSVWSPACLLRAKIELSTAQTYCPTVARGVSFLVETPFRAFGFRGKQRENIPAECTYLNKASFSFSYLCARRLRRDCDAANTE